VLRSNSAFLIFAGPTGRVRRQIFTLDGSNDAVSRQGVRFGGFVDITLHFAGEIPQNPFGGANRRFQAKWAYYRNVSIDVNEILQKDREHQVVIVGGHNTRLTDPIWRRAAILNKKTVKSQYLCNRLID